MRAYTITHKGVASGTSVVTLIELTAHTNRTVLVTRASISQQGSTSSAQQQVSMQRKTAAGTNATSPNVNPYDVTDTAFAGTVRGMCTSEGTLGVDLITDSFNWVNGWNWLPTPEEYIEVKGGDIFGIRLPVAPPSLTISVLLGIKELG